MKYYDSQCDVAMPLCCDLRRYCRVRYYLLGNGSLSILGPILFCVT